MKTVSQLNWKSAGNGVYFKGIKAPKSGGFKTNSVLNNNTQETFQSGKKADNKKITPILKSILPLFILCVACGCYTKFLKGNTQLSEGLEAISKYHSDKFNEKISSLSAFIKRIRL